MYYNLIESNLIIGTKLGPISSTVMGRVCMGRVGYVPNLLCAEFVMGRVCHVPSLLCAELYLNCTNPFITRQSISFTYKTDN